MSPIRILNLGTLDTLLGVGFWEFVFQSIYASSLDNFTTVDIVVILLISEFVFQFMLQCFSVTELKDSLFSGLGNFWFLLPFGHKLVVKFRDTILLRLDFYFIFFTKFPTKLGRVELSQKKKKFGKSR